MGYARPWLRAVSYAGRVGATLLLVVGLAAIRASFNHFQEALAAAEMAYGAVITAAYLLILIHTCVALHEAGHWIAARLLGMPVLGFQVGPLMLHRVSPKQPWNLKLVSRLFSGTVTTFSLKRDKLLAVYCAGPIASATFTLLGFFGMLVFHSDTLLQTNANLGTAVSHNLWFSLTLANIFYLLASLLPNAVQEFCTDGWMILTILTRTDPWSEAEEVRKTIEQEQRFRQPVSD